MSDCPRITPGLARLIAAKLACEASADEASVFLMREEHPRKVKTPPKFIAKKTHPTSYRKNLGRSKP